MFKLKTVIIAVLFVLGSHAQEVQSFSLFEAQDYAINNIEKLKNAKLDLESAEKKVIETRAIGLPQISASASFQNFLNLPVQVVDASFINPNAQPGETVQFRAGTDYNANGTLSVNQLLFDGSYLVGLQVSKFYTEFVGTSIERTKQDVLADVTQAYQMALVSKSNLVFVESLLKSTEVLVDKQRNYFELGLMTKEDMDQLEFSLLNAKTAKLNSENQLKSALAYLKLTMAFPQEKEIVLTEELETVLAKSTLDANGNKEDNLNLQLLKKQLILSEYSLKNTKFANLPSVGAFFQQQYNTFRNEEFLLFADERWFSQTFWGVQINVPIFSSGQRWAVTQQAKIDVMKNQNNIEEFQRTLSFQEIQVKNNLETAKQNLDLQKQNVALAQSIYENEVAKKEIGKGNSISVTQKYTQLISAQTQYVGAMIEVFNAKLELDKLYNKVGNKN
ncbi:MAG: TolC family protein [Lishizhenia sp.]